MRVRDVMSMEVRSIAPTDDIAHAARIMARDDMGILPVVDDDKPVGIVTDRDLVVRGLAAGLHDGAPVFRVMTAGAAACGPDDDLDVALHAMGEQQLRRMPVCSEEGMIVGMLSIADVARLDPDHKAVADCLRKICRPHGQHCQTMAA